MNTQEAVQENIDENLISGHEIDLDEIESNQKRVHWIDNMAIDNTIRELKMRRLGLNAREGEDEEDRKIRILKMIKMKHEREIKEKDKEIEKIKRELYVIKNITRVKMILEKKIRKNKTIYLYIINHKDKSVTIKTQNVDTYDNMKQFRHVLMGINTILKYMKLILVTKYKIIIESNNI